MAITLDPYETSTETFSDINRHTATDNDTWRAGPSRNGKRKESDRKDDHEHDNKKQR